MLPDRAFMPGVTSKFLQKSRPATEDRDLAWNKECRGYASLRNW